MSDHQCPSCGGFCKKSGCERANIKPASAMTRSELIADLRLNHEYCPKEVILLAADMLEADGKLAAPAQQPLSNEQHIALREAFAIGAADSYFEAYPTHNNDVGRMLFERGFARGFDSHERAVKGASL